MATTCTSSAAPTAPQRTSGTCGATTAFRPAGRGCARRVRDCNCTKRHKPRPAPRNEASKFLPPFLHIVAGEGPSARADHACVNLGDGRLLIQGGADLKNEVMYDDAFLLDLESLRWTQVATTGTKPFGRNGHSMVVVTPGELLVFGGASPEEGPQNDMYVLRLTGEAEGVWEQLTWEGEGPPERDLHAGCVISLGENSTSASGDIAEEAPEDVTGDAGCDEAKVPETPQTEGDAGEPAVESSAAPTESKTPARRNGMCVIGGRGVMGNVFDDAWVFDLAAGTWSRLRSLPGPRCAAAAATLEVDGQEVVVLQGGWDGATSISGDLYAFTVREGGWSSAGVSETPRFGGCGCAGASGEDLYVFGGINPGADLADVMVLRGAPAP
mmetsp:Transcript_9733/g.28553  ORF Transcript_9733/g.28553 Transcript_9733/m.28553 type:complete len:384 (+) Transcript_9733:611-1762(+)